MNEQVPLYTKLPNRNWFHIRKKAVLSYSKVDFFVEKQAPTSGSNKHLKSASNFRKVSEKKAEVKEGKTEEGTSQNVAKEENDRSAATFSGDETSQERLQPIGASNTSMLADDIEMGKFYIMFNL